MPKIDSTPQHLRPFIFHGVDLTWSDGEKQAKGDCPFCGKEGKFSVETATGLWRCWVCGTGNEKGGGNALLFIRKLYDECNADEVPLKHLADERRLLDWQTLVAWGVAVSPLTGDYVIPGYDVGGKLSQLYKYADVGGKKRLLATAGLEHQLFGVNLYDPKKSDVVICEGPWDAMAVWETINATKVEGGEYVMTASEESSLGAYHNVLAVPGCNVFNERWSELLDKKSVTICFDSDHPHENGKQGVAAGFAGTKRIVSILSKSEGRPSEVSWLAWGPDGYDPSLAPGYDVRDALKDGADMPERCRLLGELLAKIEPVPDDWVPGRRPGVPNKAKGDVGLECVPCHDWKTLINAWRKPLKWTEGLNKALACMLSSVVSTMSVGDQLWLRVLGPPACGKSTLCEALAVNRKYIYPKSTLRGFHSGYDDGSGDNHSPLDAMKDKTLVIKDGDTLLKSPNLDQILSEARDVYDRVSRSSYRNKQSKNHDGLNITFILCGTLALRALDTSELGERYLTVCIAENVDPDLEDEVLWRKINQADQNMAFESAGDPESQFDPSLLKAMQLTGGYVAHLRQHANELLKAVHSPEKSLRQLVPFAKFVAYLRARPSKSQDESVEREFATRLGSQLTRLAKGLAVVFNKDSIDDEVIETVRSVVLDTAKGRTLEIAKHLANAGAAGMSAGSLAILTNQTEDAERKLLRFLRKIGAVESFTLKESSRPKWRLTPTMSDLYAAVTQPVSV